MATLNQIAYNLLNVLRGGRSSQGDHISLEQIKFNIQYYRSVFIRRDQERNYNRYTAFEQDLGILETSKIDTAETEGIYGGGIITRTTRQIPVPIRLKRSMALTYVGCPDKQAEPYPVVEAHRPAWNAYNKFTSDNSEAFYRNRYIYITNDITIRRINVRGIFEDPIEVFNFVNPDILHDDNTEYPIPEDMIEGITRGLLNGELTMMLETPNDTQIGPTQE